MTTLADDDPPRVDGRSLMTDGEDVRCWTAADLEAETERWEAHLHAQGKAAGTIRTYVRDARAFLAFMTDDGHGDAVLPKRPPRRPGPRPRAAKTEPISVPADLRKVHALWVSNGRPAQRAFPWPERRWIDELSGHAVYLDTLPKMLDRSGVADRCGLAAGGPQQAL